MTALDDWGERFEGETCRFDHYTFGFDRTKKVAGKRGVLPIEPRVPQ